MIRKLLLSVCGLLAWVVPQLAIAQDAWPTRPIRLVVPFPPGGSADAVGRPLAERLSSALGQPLVVENRGGGNTVIGGEVVARAAPDGYTLFLMPGAHVLSPKLMKAVPFDPVADFSPVSLLVTTPYVIFGGKKQPFDSFESMVRYAKANPGGVSIGTTDALGKAAVAMLKRSGAVDLLEVSYKGAPNLVADVVGGHLQLGINTPVVTAGLQRAGTAQALALTSRERLPMMKELSTVSELTGEAGFDIFTWFILAGPAGLPESVLARLEQAVQSVLSDRTFRDQMSALGMTPQQTADRAGARQFMRDYSERMGAALVAAGIQPQ